MADIKGELKRAQMEQAAGMPAAPQPTGRIMADITNPAAALPMFFDGTTWRQLAYPTVIPPTTNPLTIQNSGSACTVDWSVSRFQQVVLTADCRISFANPVEGEIHTLVVKQNGTPTFAGGGPIYLYSFDSTAIDSRHQPYQPTRPIQFAEQTIHQWLYQAAAKPARLTIPTIPSMPLQVLATSNYAGSFSPDGRYYASGNTGSAPGFAYYEMMDPQYPLRNFLGNPFGRLTPNGITASGVAGTSTDFSPCGRFFVQAYNNDGSKQVYNMDRGVPQTRFPNSGTGSSAAFGVNWHPRGNFVAFCGNTTPFIETYEIINTNNNIVGARIANPGILPPAACWSVAWSPFGDFVSLACESSPFIITYPFTEVLAVGSYGAKVGDPTLLPAGKKPNAVGGKGIAWRPQGDWIAMAMDVAPFLYVVPFNRATATYGTPLTIANGIITQIAQTVTWSKDGQYLIVGTNDGAQTLYVFDFSAGTITTPITFDSLGISQRINDVTVNPNNEYVVCSLNAAPWVVAVYLPQKARSYVNLMQRPQLGY